MAETIDRAVCMTELAVLSFCSWRVKVSSLSLDSPSVRFQGYSLIKLPMESFRISLECRRCSRLAARHSRELDIGRINAKNAQPLYL